LAYLFVPLASLVFLVRHWAEAKKGFMVNLAGLLICCIPMAFSGEMRESVTKDFMARFGKDFKGQKMDLTAQIAAQRAEIEEMETEFNKTSAALIVRYQALGASRQALKRGDTEAITRFNTEVTAYQEEVDALKEDKQEIREAKKELDAMLAERAKQAAAAGGKQASL
jgi:N-methylhydantoinase B/oxoprolinase/acetone carboxylase alpha subunit